MTYGLISIVRVPVPVGASMPTSVAAIDTWKMPRWPSEFGIGVK